MVCGDDLVDRWRVLLACSTCSPAFGTGFYLGTDDQQCLFARQGSGLEPGWQDRSSASGRFKVMCGIRPSLMRKGIDGMVMHMVGFGLQFGIGIFGALGYRRSDLSSSFVFTLGRLPYRLEYQRWTSFPSDA